MLLAVFAVFLQYVVCSFSGFPSNETILLDFRRLKKVRTANSDETDEVSLVERVFQTHLQTSSDSLAHAIVSLQQYDPEWETLLISTWLKSNTGIK